jgi:hypothetical protein
VDVVDAPVATALSDVVTLREPLAAPDVVVQDDMVLQDDPAVVVQPDITPDAPASGDAGSRPRGLFDALEPAPRAVDADATSEDDDQAPRGA